MRGTQRLMPLTLKCDQLINFMKRIMHSNIIWLLKQCLLSIIETDLDKLSSGILNNVLMRKIIKFSGY